MEARFDQAVDQVPTELEVETSPGEPPPVSLQGGADPARSAEQEEAAAAQAESLRGQAEAAVDHGPGPEQVQPGSCHETNEVAPVEPATLEPLAEIPEMGELMAAPIPEDVRAETDALGQEQLDASLSEAKIQLDTADADRDTARDAEIQRAEGEEARLNDEAEAAQDAEVERGRGEIDGAREETRQAQRDAVTDLDDQAAEQRTTLEGDIEARVQADERAIDDRYGQAERDAQAKREASEQQARERKDQAERDAENDSWWDRALDAISSFFNALLEFVNDLFDALIAAVGVIIDAAKAAVTVIIDAVRDFAISLVRAYGELLKGLVDGLFGDLFPGLAAGLTAAIDLVVEIAVSAINWIADQLKAGLLALLGAIGAALTVLLEAYRAAISGALSVLQAVLAGDWAALGRMILEAALTLAGIVPAAFYAFVGQAEDTIGIIINDPVGFLRNLFGAVALGFNLFVENIVDHLQTGFFEWIVGPLGELGVTLPDTWDIWSILGIVLQILRLTQAGIRAVIIEELGAAAGAVFDFVWTYVDALITGGWRGLWEQIQGDLSSLWGMVVEGIMGWLISTAIIQGTAKLLALIDPSFISQIVQVVIVSWQIYTFLRDNLQRIWGVVTSVVSTISEIARGILQTAGEMVEDALASLIPITISLLANLLGLGAISARVQAIIEGIREKVRNAIGNLIRRVRGLFTGGGEGGAEPEGEEGGPADFSPVSFEVAGESGEMEPHEVYYEVSGAHPVMMAASGGGAPVATAVSSGELEAVDGPAEQQALAAVGPGESAAAEAVAAEDPEARVGAVSQAQQQLTQVGAALQQGSTYPEPLGGQHQLRGPTPPDGQPRQSHHVPPKALGRTIAQMLSGVATRLGQSPWVGSANASAMTTALSQRSGEDEGTAGGNGDDLSAMLLRDDTHHGFVHGEATAAPILSQLASSPGANIVVVMRRTANRLHTEDILARFISVNPQVRNWRDFLAACLQAIHTGQAPQEVPGTQPADTLVASAQQDGESAEMAEQVQLQRILESINALQDRAVHDAFVAGQLVVEAGLNGNQKEGTEQGRRTALLQMEDTFHGSWLAITDPISVDWA